MTENGNVYVQIKDGVAWMRFHHPKKNSLPGALLRRMAEEVSKIGQNNDARVVVLAGEGDGPFCAGASFDELKSIRTLEKGKEFFMGFATLILAMKQCPKFIIARVHGKAVGGGVGIVAASDYAFAVKTASLKLSELAFGIGPFVVGPCVEKKVGAGAFAAMSIDADWRDAAWGKTHGIYADVFETVQDLDKAVQALAEKLAKSSPDAMRRLKEVFWQDAQHWDQLLPARAEISGQLVLSDFTVKAIAAFERGA